MCGCNLVAPHFIGGERRSNSGSLAMLAAMRRASSRVRSGCGVQQVGLLRL
jgi:hypothetical protein